MLWVWSEQLRVVLGTGSHENSPGSHLALLCCLVPVDHVLYGQANQRQSRSNSPDGKDQSKRGHRQLVLGVVIEREEVQIHGLLQIERVIPKVLNQTSGFHHS